MQTTEIEDAESEIPPRVDADEIDRSDLRRPFGARPGIVPGPPGTESEAGNGPHKLINEWIEKLKSDPQAYVAVHRVRPEFIEGIPARGASGRYTFDVIRNADDLLQAIERENGGSEFDLKFCGTTPSGHLKPLKSIRVTINAKPILRMGEGAGTTKARTTGDGTAVLSPDAEMAKDTFSLLKGMITDLRDGNKGKDNPDQTKLFELIKELNQPSVDGYKQTIEFQRTELAEMRRRLDDLGKNGHSNGVNTEALKFAAEKSSEQLRQTEERFANERAQWQSERSRLLSDHEKERKELNDKLGVQIDKLTEKLESSQDKLRDLSEKAADDRKRLEENHQQALRHKEEMQQRDTSDFRRQLDNESKRLSDQLSDERRSSEKLKEHYELLTKAQLEKQEAIFRETIGTQSARLAALEERNKDLERRYEDKIRDLEKRKEELQKEIIDTKTNRPDALASIEGTIGSVTKIAGALGLSKGSEAPARTEIGQLLQDAKDAGVVDAAKNIALKLGDAFKRQPMPQSQAPIIYQVPVNPNTGMPMVPAFQPQMAPQPPIVQPGAHPFVQQPPQQQFSAPPPSPPPQQQSQQPQAQQPPGLGEAELAVWKTVIEEFETSMESGLKPPDMAVKVLNELPRVVLKQVTDAGTGEFKKIVEYICQNRPENPDSILLTPRGDMWLKELFVEVQKGLG